ncbi:RagB/SusD family nutrient uptake outer membrane protein [Labilibaculum euxinus]
MKKIKIIIQLFLMLVMLSGCTDYLDVKPRGYDVPEKLEHYAGLLYGKDDIFTLSVFPNMSFEFTTTENGYNFAYSVLGAEDMNAYKWESDIFRTDDVCSEWNDPCKQLYTINLVVDEVLQASDGTEDEKKAVWAEARVMRAWYTFMMAQFFGAPYNESTAASDLCIPIITTSATVDVEFPRAKVQEVYNYVITEMEESLPFLEDREEHFKRIFMPTGNAMLGKVYWMMGKYEKALPYLQVAKNKIDSDGSRGLLNYNDLMEEGEISYPNVAKTNPESLYSESIYPRLWLALYPSFIESTLLHVKTEVLEKYFTPNDYRLAMVSGLNSGLSAYAQSSLDPSDYYYPNSSRIATDIGVTVADVYLMYAECLARNSQTTEAKSVLTEFRENRIEPGYADIPADVNTQEELIKFVVAERIREGIGMGTTWFDMRRLWDDSLFQDMKQYYTHTDGIDTYSLTKERLTMKIPPSVIIWNPEYQNNN